MLALEVRSSQNINPLHTERDELFMTQADCLSRWWCVSGPVSHTVRPGPFQHMRTPPLRRIWFSAIGVMEISYDS